MTEPLQHQADHVTQHWEDPHHACFWEMGTGKTLTNLLVAEWLFLNDRITTLLVTAPNGVHLEWLDQAGQHLTAAYRGLAWSSYENKEQRLARERMLKRQDNLKIVCLNVDAMSSLKAKGTVFLAKLLKEERVLWVMDESYVIKNPKAGRTKAIFKLAPFAKYRRILSGAPILEKPFDVWAQAQFLQQGLLGNNYWKFTRRYAEWQRAHFGQRSFSQVKQYTNLDELRGYLLEFSSFIKKKECLDLPEKTYREVPVEMTPAQWRAYNELRDLMATWLDDGTEVTAKNAMDRLHKFHGVTMGYLKVDEGVYKQLNTHRPTVLMNLLEEIGEQKVIIWCNHVEALQAITCRIAQQFGESSVAMYYGAIDEETRHKLRKEFQKGHELRYLVINQSVGARGLNLTAASKVIYYANSYKLEERVQSEDRCHRIGQTENVEYIDLVARGTTDERVLNALKRKVDVANEVLGGHLRLEQWV